MTAVPAHSLYGVPASRGSRPAGMGVNAAPAPAGGMPFDTRYCSFDTGGNPCQGFKAKGTDLCMGHLRSVAKAKAVADESE